jgi:hypothetical protein
MKTSDYLLQRLFRAASKARRSDPESMPAGLNARVLSQWRRLEWEDEISRLLPVFQRAVLCASAVMLLSVGWGWTAGSQESAGHTALANYAMKVQLSP